MKLKSRLLLVIIFVLQGTGAVSAQTKGNITGKVYDATGGEGLPGVNVLVTGTYYGAATDLEGNYSIQGVNPGTYTIEVKMMGYKQIQNTGVRVQVGETTILNFKLEETVLALGQDVVIIGQKPLFDIEETASRKSLSSKDIEVEAVESIRDIISNQVGVTRTEGEIHIRGGRSHENAYLLDGISVQDPLSGTGFGLEMSADAIEELEVITGGFNAEYGQAMSGIINVKTKDGSNNYRGGFSYKVDHLGSHSPGAPLLGNLSSKSKHSFNTDIFEVNLSGPEPLTQKILPALGLHLPGSLTFFSSGYMMTSDTYLGAKAKQLSSSTFHGETFAPKQNNSWSGILKLTYKPSPTMKLTLAGNQSVSINQNTQSLQTNLEFVEPSPGYPYAYQNNLDNFNTFTHLNEQLSLSWTHTLNTKSFYEIKLARFFSNLRSDVNGKHWSQMEEPQDIVTLDAIDYLYNRDSSYVTVFPGDGFWDFGDGETWHDHYIEEYTLKFDLTRQFANNSHEVKTGVQTSFAEMQLVDIFRPWFGELGLNNDLYQVKPAYGSFYAQDQFRFKGLIANVGLRLDYWFPGKYVEDAIANQQIVTITDATRSAFNNETASFFGRRYRSRLSPRIGISHPISDNQMLFFSYGHFSKRPKPQFVYAKLGANSALSTFQQFGNPNLDYETTVAYEFGLRHKFSDNDALTATAFYRDIFDYVTTINFRGTGRLSGRSFTTYLNLDYARSRGVEIEYRTRPTRHFSGSINGSYSIATGKSSSPDDAFLVAQGSLSERPITENLLIWDRPWQAGAVVNFFIDKGQAPTVFGWTIPDNWNFNARAFAQAGKRYTPQFATGLFLPSGRPQYTSDLDQNGESDNPLGKLSQSWFWINLNFEKYFQIVGLKYSFSVEVENLLDRKNPQIVNPVTGSAYEYGDPTPTSFNDPLFPDVQAPVQPFPFNPARYLTQRNIKLGLSVRF